ncbi:MAG: zonular occludens toxin domain-containing protein [Eubacterium sp.]
MAVIILTTGAPGTGKTYSRVRWLVRNFLVENKTGLYITNFRLNADEIAADVAKRTSQSFDEVLSRIVVIPDSELLLWRYLSTSEYKTKLQKNLDDTGFPPAVFFQQYNLENSHIAIDEFHRYFCKSNSALWGKCWNEFFAEVRKLGCTFEAITQDLSLIPTEFIGKVGYRIDLLPFADERDPFFKIPLFDWYQLRSSYTGDVAQKICQVEYKKGTSFTGRVAWKKAHHENFEITPDYYKFYNSYQASEQDQSISHVKQPFEIYGKRIVFWFIRRHFWKLLCRFLLVALFFYGTFGGGIVMLIGGFTSTLAAMSNANRLPAQNSSSKHDNVSDHKSNSLPAQNSSSKSDNVSASNTTLSRDQHKRLEQNAISYGTLQDDEALYKPSLFFERDCWLRNGLKIRKNYKFKGGLYDGKVVTELDVVERYYVLDDDKRISMF